MSKAVSRPFDSADSNDTPEAVAAYLEAALEDGDAQIIAATPGDIARSKGMAGSAERTGLARETLHKSLSADGNPSLTTLLSVLKAMGLRLSVTADPHQAAQARLSCSRIVVPTRALTTGAGFAPQIHGA